MNESADLTPLLTGADAPGATDRLLESVYPELRRVAAGFLRHERPDHTLQPTALVHEAYLRLVDQTRVPWQGRAHFRAVAAQAMRRVLVDHARRRGADKRGGDRRRVTLSDLAQTGGPPIDVLDLERALAAFAREHERGARVVEMKVFAGMTGEEIACVLGISARTVKSDWAIAKLWLARRLQGVND
ncbi:MAG: sigma-70 family RNA polymerase sigma factor [bacterium]